MGISNEVRVTLQGGIQDVLRALRTANLQEKDDLNDLMQFYRSMHSMSLQAIKIERKLNGSRLQPTTAAEIETPRQSRRDANRTGVQETAGEPDPTWQSGTARIVLDFSRPKDANVVREQKSQNR